MLILSSHLIGLPVGATENQSKIGEIWQIIFESKNGSILGFLVNRSFWQKKKVLAKADVLSLDEDAAVVSSADSLIEIDEVVRIKEVLENNIPIIGQIAKTENGKNLGRVDNVLIDTSALTIVKFYLKNLLEDRIIPFDKVIKITKQAVIFQNDEEQVKESMAPEVAII